MKIGVLGSGNGATALAYEIPKKGYEVIISDLHDFLENIKVIAGQGGIYSTAEKEDFVPVEAVEDIGYVFEQTDIVFITSPAYGIKNFAQQCKKYVKKGHKIILCPGSVGGALEFKKEIGKDFLDEEVIIAETSTLPYASRLKKPGQVEIYLFVKKFLLSAVPSSKTEEIYEFARTIWPAAEKAKNVMQTALSCGNPVIHPPITLLNTALIERTKGNFKFYADGVTKGVGNLIKRLDEERLALGKALGIEIISEPEMGVRQGYMERANYWDGYSESKVFKNIMAPPSLDYRFINEDIAYGLIFWSSLGDLIGVETPVIDSMITLASVIVDKNLWENPPRTVSGLGLTHDIIKKL
jgi:opine dehydrogenase